MNQGGRILSKLGRYRRLVGIQELSGKAEEGNRGKLMKRDGEEKGEDCSFVRFSLESFTFRRYQDSSRSSAESCDEQIDPK